MTTRRSRKPWCLTNQAREEVLDSLLKGFGGVSALFLSLWRSRTASAEAEGDDDVEDDGDRDHETDWQVLNDATTEKLAAFSWLEAGCPALNYGLSDELPLDPRTSSRVDRPEVKEPKDPFGKAPEPEAFESPFKNLPPPPKELLLLANPDGSLKPPFDEEWGDEFRLEPPDLTPAWWWWAVEGQELSPEERALDFQANLEAVLPLYAKSGGSLTPQDVLKCLVFLRSLMPLGPTPAPD